MLKTSLLKDRSAMTTPMDKNNQNGGFAKNFFWGALLGAMAGFAMGILYAPDEGEKTRKVVEQKKKEFLKTANKIKKDAEPVVKKMIEVVEPLVEEIEKKIEPVKTEVAKEVQEVQKEVKKKKTSLAKKTPNLFKGIRRKS